jgi:hypothetical protein
LVGGGVFGKGTEGTEIGYGLFFPFFPAFLGQLQRQCACSMDMFTWEVIPVEQAFSKL